jgi:hypothetical protein
MSLQEVAATLVERLRNAHRMRADSGATNNARHAAAIVAQDLVDEASPELLRAALTLAVQPDGGQPPVPVVFGPQDVAAIVGVDEVMALVDVYNFACLENRWESAGKAAAELRNAVQALALAASVSGGAA